MKARKISDYIKTYPQLHSWLYFNVVSEAPDNMALLTDSDNTLQEFIDGSKEKEYLFDVAMLSNYDDGTSDVNMNALEEAQKLIEWISSNNDNEIYPDFGADCTVEEIEVLNDVPQVTVSESNIARYMLSLRILYLERTK